MGYSARRGFTNGKISGAARQAELQQKIAVMQEKMTAAQDAVEAQEFTASVGGGVLEGDQLTVFAPDEITLNRLDNDRVRGVLSAEAEKVSGQPVRLLLRKGEPPKPSPEENLKQLLQFGSQFDNIEIK